MTKPLLRGAWLGSRDPFKFSGVNDIARFVRFCTHVYQDMDDSCMVFCLSATLHAHATCNSIQLLPRGTFNFC